VKIRSDFVTNSSSTAYVLVFQVPADVGLEDVLDCIAPLNTWQGPEQDTKNTALREELKNTMTFEYEEAMERLVRRGEGRPQIVTIRDTVSMHNDYNDVPEYMRNFVFALLNGDIGQYKLVKWNTAHSD